MRAAIVVILGATSLFLSAQHSPFNGLSVVPADSAGHYRILIGGHFHGASYGRSGYPAATLLASLDSLNALNTNVFLSTGDLFLSADMDSARYARSLFSKLKVALFNAPGNHDVEGKVYERSYGPRHLVFDIGPDRVIILDTERDNGDIIGDQLQLLEQQVDGFTGRHLFILSHRPVWSEEDPRYGPLFKGNTRSAFGNNFTKAVYPLLEKIANRSNVHWISGSMAGMAPASIFFQEHIPGLTYIQCAIRDQPRDALLVADVSGDSITWLGVSLTGESLNDPRTYTAEYWAERQADPNGFNWRLLPYLVQKTVTGIQFWFGFLVAMGMLLLVRLLFRRGF